MLISKREEEMEGNMKELLQTILYLGGIMYSIIYGLQKLKKQNFTCTKNKAYFIMGTFGMTLGLSLFAYLVYCLEFAAMTRHYLLLLFCYACLTFPISGYLYFTSLINEAEYGAKKNYDYIFAAEYMLWRKKRCFCGAFGVIMCIMTLAYFLILQ